MEGVRRLRKPEWLPMVTCIGLFHAVETGGDRDGSCLTLVWYQPDFALPIAPEIAKAMQALDWERIAEGFQF
jgi:hypothetical protein